MEIRSVEYPWIDDSKSPLKRDFGPEDLAPLLRRSQIDRVITVQARQTLVETKWLIELASQDPMIAGVVGWVPLADQNVERVLEGLAGQKALKGVRHVVQDEPDDAFILGQSFNRGVSLLDRFGLVYDILIFARHLPATIRFVDSHPQHRSFSITLANRPYAATIGTLPGRRIFASWRGEIM